MDFSNMFVAGGAVLASAMRIGKTTISDSESEEDDIMNSIDISSLMLGDDEDLMLSDEEFDEEDLDLPDNVFPETPPPQKRSGTPKKMAFGGIMPYQAANLPSRFGQAKTRNDPLLRHYESSVFNGSDIDIFLYGLSEDNAEKKIEEMEIVFRKNLPKTHKDVLVIRTKQALTFHFGVS
jgi:hypothetical protein